MKIAIWHNIMWSTYKAAVFTEMFKLAQKDKIDVVVFQIAETSEAQLALSPVDPKSHQYPYVNLFKGSYSNIPRLQLFKKAVGAASASKAELTILAGFDRLEYWLQLLALRSRRRKTAVFCNSTLYDNPRKFWKGLAKRLFFRLCDGAFCYGARSRAYLKHYGMPEEFIFHRCQASVPVSGYDKSAVAALRVASLSTKPQPRYLYVGRLAPEKRIGALLHAFKSLLATFCEAELAIVGAGPDDADLRALAETLGVGAQVRFTGPKSGPALVDEYLRANCLVLPSWSEPWGLVVNEALSYGCPALVSHRCGCVPELIRDGATGFVFQCDDVADLADKMKRAPKVFANIAATADACLRQIEPFTSKVAAEELLAGCLKLLQ